MFITLKKYQHDVNEAHTPFLEVPEVAKCTAPQTLEILYIKEDNQLGIHVLRNHYH